MAEEQQDTEQGTSSARKKLKMAILIGVGVILIVTLSVAGTWFMLSSADSDETESSQASAGMVDGTIVTDGPAMYLAMQPPFVVNYTSGARTRFLQMELSLVSRSPVAIDTANAHMPLIRNNLLDVLARQDFNELQTMEGKQALVEELTVAVQAVMQEKLGHPGIETVLFRSFVMQ